MILTDGPRHFSVSWRTRTVSFIEPPQAPPPTELPQRLPPELLPDLIARGRLLLCLDFDGTLSEIASRPSQARPVGGVPQLLAALSKHRERIEVAIVSGREVEDLRRLLHIDSGLTLVGDHGIEIADRDGHRCFAPGVADSAPELDKVRNWMSRVASARSGFVIEHKHASIAMHYRLADPQIAGSIRSSLREFVESECPKLRILSGKMVDEVMPRAAGGKGLAVRRLLDSLTQPDAQVVYFGDDTTDEDAFFELREGGATVLVGLPRPTWAHYQLPGPPEVASTLANLLATLEPLRHN